MTINSEDIKRGEHPATDDAHYVPRTYVHI